MILLVAGLGISYLLGAIPTAFLAAKYVKGVDIRTQGSGNVGATNAMRVVGKTPGIIVLVLDAAKGFVAVTLLANVILAASEISHPYMLRALFGFAAVCGHIFNIFLQGKGGKGVATGLGVLLGIAPAAAGVGIAVFAAVVAWKRYVSLASIAACVVIPFFMAIRHYPGAYCALAATLCVLIVAKHKENIRRLLIGQERKVFKKA